MDGKISRNGDSKWITSEKSRKYVREIRNNYDAILVGSKTVIKDNPSLAGTRREPKRIILDSYLKVPLNSKVFVMRIFLWQRLKSADKKIKILGESAVLILNYSIRQKVNRIKSSYSPARFFLANNGVSSILVEGGGEIFDSFINKNLVNKFYWFIAPKLSECKKNDPSQAYKKLRT